MVSNHLLPSCSNAAQHEHKAMGCHDFLVSARDGQRGITPYRACSGVILDLLLYCHLVYHEKTTALLRAKSNHLYFQEVEDLMENPRLELDACK